MDIKISFVRAVCLIAVFAVVVEAASYPGNRNDRGTPRRPSGRNNRREIRDYLAPPAPDASYTSYGPPALEPHRPGRRLNPPPPTEAPGYFARLTSWLNPFGGSAAPPPLPEISGPFYAGKHAPSRFSDVYELPPPPSSSSSSSTSPPRDGYGPQPPPPPPGSQGYLPANGKGKNCNPCNVVPWNPMPGLVHHGAYPSGQTDVEIQASVGQEGKDADGGVSLGYSEGVRTPDFGHGPPPSQRPSFPGFSSHGSPPSVPIPYPHLYPGPMPPLFKAKPFGPPPEAFRPTPSVELASGPPEHVVASVPGVAVSGTPDPLDGHVEVLPPGAEIDVSGTDAVPPPSGYRENYGHGHGHGDGYGSASLSVQQSTAIHEQHSSAELTAGYEIREPGSVEVTKSLPVAEYSASVDHPIHYEQSPLIDLTNRDEKPSEHHRPAGDGYTAGLNPPPPPGDSVGSHSGAPDEPKDVPTDGFQAFPPGQKSPGDSSVASTVTNATSFRPTPSYGIPDIGALPVSHEQTAKPPVYEAYPPSTEESVSLPTNASSGQRQTPTENGEVVDSYQRQVNPSVVGQNHEGEGRFGFARTPEPLVPYRPGSLYVPYPPYSGPSSRPELADSAPTTTEEPFLDALLKSYDNFKREMDATDHTSGENGSPVSGGGTTWVSQPQPSFSSPEKINPSVYARGNTNGKQQPGTKRNKQVQIIIPYTSQYTPGPFRAANDDWSGRGPLEQTQARKVPGVGKPERNYVGEESKSVEIARPFRPLENLLIKELAGKPAPAKRSNNSIDVTRLQKNIDNWTIQEYSRGLTSSTALPSSSHPYLLPSKKIPNEYLTSTQPSPTEEKRDDNRPDLPGLSYNDLEHEGAASSRVEVPRVQVLRVEAGLPSTESTSTTTTPSTSSAPTSTEASWAELPVSISPHNNERVYVVTPQPERSAKSRAGFDGGGKYEAIERAYQVLPEAVNNLASASVSGPDVSPLWGIMEHDQYARNDRGNSSDGSPVLYSGHSKVSNARQ